MSDSIDIQPIKTKLASKGPILIIFGPQANVDYVASSLALFLVLKQAGHDVYIASPAELRTEFSRLVGLDKVSKTVGNKNLVISFTHYDSTSIEKVSVSDSIPNRFELIIQPKPGQKSPDPKNIEYTYKGVDAQLIFLIGVTRLEDLGQIYETDSKVFNDATTVAFNRRQAPVYAAISVLDNSASSISEMVYEFLGKLELQVSGDSASNLLAGIDFATNRFQNPLISPNAFITAGRLIQSGAKRQPPTLTSSTPFSSFPSAATNPGFIPFAPPSNFNHPFTPPTTKPQYSTNQKPLPKPQQSKTPPKDWLEPKIYKGGSRV